MAKHAITSRRARLSRHRPCLRCSTKIRKLTGGRCSMLRSTRRREDPPERRQGERQGWQREQRDDLTLSEARHILWERRALVAGCTLFFILVAFLYSLSGEPVYT